MDVNEQLADLVDQIRALRPAHRRRLLQRLRAAGLMDLLEPEAADRDRLRVAPALSRRRPALPPVAHVKSQTPASLPPAEAGSTAPPAATSSEPYRSTVRGKVVVAASNPNTAPAPSEMPPLPGQAPESPIQIVFDGGSRGNPGPGYGSYAIRWPGRPAQVVRLRFGETVTNNEAEYDTLIAGLTTIRERLQEQRADLATTRLDIRGDSLLVINQVLGEWQCKEPRMRSRRDQVRRLLADFGGWQLSHHDREESVRILGH